MAGTLNGMVHLPDVELISSDVVKPRLLLLLDGALQFVDSCRRENANRKDVRIVEPENPTVE